MATYPGASDTGYTNAPGYTSLTDYNGTVASNTTYSHRRFSGGADIDAGVVNVTFYGCLFEGYSPDMWLVHNLGDNITFNYCTFRPDSGTVGYRTYASGDCYQYGIHSDSSTAHTLTVTNCDFWGFGNAFQVNGSTQAKPHTFRRNWFHHAADNTGTSGGIGSTYHHDGILCTVGGANYDYVVIDNNTFESLGNTNAIALQLDGGTGYSYVRATRNKISGWGYAVAIGNSSSANDNNLFADNVFTTEIYSVYGALYDWTGTNRKWRRNRWSVPDGAAWGNAADDGKYWTPGGVSATDAPEGVVYPDVPTAVSGTAGSGQVSVAFTAPSDNGGATISGYRVTHYLDGVSQGTTTGSSSPIVVSGLDNDTYTFTVAATNSAGYGFESDASGGVTVGGLLAGPANVRWRPA